MFCRCLAYLALRDFCVWPTYCLPHRLHWMRYTTYGVSHVAWPCVLYVHLEILLRTCRESINLLCSGQWLLEQSDTPPRPPGARVCDISVYLRLAFWIMFTLSIVVSACCMFDACVWFVASVVDSSSRFGLSFALTNLLARLALALYASLGVLLRNLFSMGMSVSMFVQCLWSILNALPAVGQNLVTKVGFVASNCASVSLFLLFLVFSAIVVRMLNLIFFSSLVILAEQ